MSVSSPNTQLTFCTIPQSRLVYAAPRSREEFDALHLPEIQHDWQRSRAATLSHADGVEWEVRVRSKSLRGSGVQVVFQWREERPTDIASSGALLKQNADIYPAVCA